MTDPVTTAERRCVIVLDETLAPGLAANAAAVLAVTLGAAVPDLIGPGFRDADGNEHPGLIDRGLPVLRASGEQLTELHARAVKTDACVIDLPRFAQQTTDYDAFRRHVGATSAADLAYLGVLVHGPKRTVARLTGRLVLLR